MDLELGRPGALGGVEGRIRDWDPALELSWEDSIPRLYDGNATQYVIIMSGTELQTDRRRVAVTRGDVAAVAADVAVDLSEAAEGVILRDFGPAPAHFRERFLQVWGFELLDRVEGPDGWRIHGSAGAAGRGSYRVEVLEHAGSAQGVRVFWQLSPLECGLLLPLGGRWEGSGASPLVIEVGEVGFVPPGETLGMVAKGRGILIRIPAPGLRPDRAHLAPEWQPRGG
jgi:hypothetical protein